jgi:hypothetical protein
MVRLAFSQQSGFGFCSPGPMAQATVKEAFGQTKPPFPHENAQLQKA